MPLAMYLAKLRDEGGTVSMPLVIDLAWLGATSSNSGLWTLGRVPSSQEFMAVTDVNSQGTMGHPAGCLGLLTGCGHLAQSLVQVPCFLHSLAVCGLKQHPKGLAQL